MKTKVPIRCLYRLIATTLFVINSILLLIPLNLQNPYDDFSKRKGDETCENLSSKLVGLGTLINIEGMKLSYLSETNSLSEDQVLDLESKLGDIDTEERIIANNAIDGSLSRKLVCRSEIVFEGNSREAVFFFLTTNGQIKYSLFRDKSWRT